jgi:hypothetical protein
MIRIDKPEPSDQPWKDWCTTAAAARTEMEKNFVPGTKPAINSDLYKAQKTAFFELFNGKCAFCEAPISPVYFDVEHFRPKSGVTEEDGTKATYVDDYGEVREHPGYYWLAYDWRNLLPSCPDCNRPTPDSGGKRNYFPLKTPADGSKPFRAHRPGDEVEEEPLFVHPWFEDPTKHFAFDEFGIIIPLTEEGEKCVQRLGLDREALEKARRQTYKDACDKFNALMGKARVDTVSAQELEIDILGWQEGRRPYSAPARVAIAEEHAIRRARLRRLGLE